MTEYLQAISDTTLRAAILESIRRLVQRPQSAGEVDRNQVVTGALHELAREPGLFWGPDAVGGARDNLQRWYSACSRPNTRPHAGHGDIVGEQPDNQRIESIFWELITRGLLYPRLANARTSNLPRVPPHVIETLVLTPLGMRYFKGASGAHPSDPNFVSTTISGIPTLPVEVRTMLEEAHACFKHGLLRSAVIMLGLAYEVMAAEVFSIVVSGKRPREAKEVLQKVEAAVQKVNDEAGVRAIRAADEIRADRNEAAHSWTADFADIGRVEMLLIMGARNVRAFWNLTGR